MTLDVARLRTELEEILRFLRTFARDPINGIRRAPEWSWPALIVLQIAVAAVSGVILGLLSVSWINLVLGIFIFPLTSLLQTAVIAAFLAAWFSMLHSTYLDHRRLFGLSVLANLPYLLLHTLSGFAPPVDLIGFGITCALLVVGLHEHFRIERKTLLRLLGGVYFVFFIVWAGSQYRASERMRHFEDLSIPKSLDKMENEL